MYDADDVAGRVGNLNIPYVQFAAFLHQMGHGCDGVALGNGLHMTATDADAHAYQSDEEPTPATFSARASEAPPLKKPNG